MIDLRSKLRQRLLGYYFTNPGARHYLRELAALLEVDAANLSRELTRLEQHGLFVSTRERSHRYFQLNTRYPLYEEIRKIVFKTVGAAGLLRDELQPIRGIEEAYLYGSFARNQQDAASDLDVLLIGKPKAAELETVIRKLERRLRREINYTLLNREEFQSRNARKDAFLRSIWRGKAIRLVGPS